MKLAMGRVLLTMGLSLLVVVAMNRFWYAHHWDFMLTLSFVYVTALAGAQGVYAWIANRFRYRGAAYCGAIVTFTLLCCVFAELFTWLRFDGRKFIYIWVVSYGGVALLSWLVLDLLFRGRMERSDRWVKPVLAAVFAVCVVCSGWYAYSLPMVRVKNPSPKDCALMVQALKDFSPEGFEEGIRLSSEAQCDWVGLGVSENSLRKSEPKTIESLWDYDSWFSVSKPSYSLFRNRAFIDVGGEWVSLGGGGERCQYDRTRKGWEKTRCEGSWIS